MALQISLFEHLNCVILSLNPQIREGSAPSNIVHLNPMPAIPIVAQLETQASCAGANANISYPPQDMQSLQNLQAHQATAPYQ